MRPRRLLLGVVLAGVLAALGGGLAVAGVGHWLAASDPLVRADAIVVTAGGLPFRAMGAAELYRQGWAPEVWLTVPSQPARDAALARLGIEVPGEEVYSRRVLERLGVPGARIRLLLPRARNTAGEVGIVGEALRRAGATRVIIVTSPPHVRRVRASWRSLAGNGLAAVVRGTGADPFDPARWWATSTDALAVAREVLGLLNVWAGFPLAPAGPAEPGEPAAARPRASTP